MNQYSQSRLGSKHVNQFEKIQGSSDTLSADDSTTSRALAARANYLSLDRPDLQFSTKELCRAFSQPTRKDYIKLKMLGRYLVGRPRMVWRFPWQDQDPSPEALHIYTDTDFAGCKVTRRSTSGSCVMRGKHCIKTSSKTQTTICLSSAEAELGGIVSSASAALGLQSVAADLGLTWSLELRADASAAIGICRRRGLGKVRHLHVSDLWVQDRLRSGDFKLVKWPGQDNLADSLTKYLERKDLETHVASMGIYVEGGRSELAPQISSQE